MVKLQMSDIQNIPMMNHAISRIPIEFALSKMGTESRDKVDQILQCLLLRLKFVKVV